VEKLAARLKDNPNDSVLGHVGAFVQIHGAFRRGQKAFDHIVEIAGNDANLLTEYADCWRFAREGILTASRWS